MTSSSKIQVAVVGAGKMGTYHAKLLGRTAEVEPFGDGDEIAQVPKFHVPIRIEWYLKDANMAGT